MKTLYQNAQSVVSPTLTIENFNAITRRQSLDIAALIRPWAGADKTVLDFGCGPGRFLPMLASVFGSVVGYDENLDLINAAPNFDNPDITLKCYPPCSAFDAVFCWVVFCDPANHPVELAKRVTAMVKPGGALIIGEHCEVEKQKYYSARFRSVDFYREVFADLGVDLAMIGEVEQVGNKITVLAGRKAL